MNLSDDQLQSMMERAGQRERKVRRAALALSLIPVVFAVVFLTLTLYSISRAQVELATTRNDLGSAQAALRQSTSTLQAVNAQLISVTRQAGSAQAQVATAQAELGLKNAALATMENDLAAKSGQLQQYQEALATAQADLELKQRALVDLDTQVRLASQFKSVRDYYQWLEFSKYKQNTCKPELCALLDQIDRVYSGSPPFNRLGADPQNGFTSPSFAAYVLQSAGYLPRASTPILTQSDLRSALAKNKLQSRRGSPREGDLCLYEEGFAMFYFVDQNRQPFVIGMTTRGIQGLAADFAKQTDVIAVLP